ncbi:MAG TPA: hypothetical protein VK468_10805, partial [Pyrinomonadaceae bacterium]|nr:hypothetical protein [Pyrinomonadaceae bacterium]
AGIGHMRGRGEDSPRRRGFKQGVFMIMLMIVLAPVIGLIFRFGFDMMPWPAGIAVFLLGGGGLLRMVYALFFESGRADGHSLGEAERRPASILPFPQPTRQLKAEDGSSYIAPTLFGTPDTNDLEPRSVTEGTTSLLEKERD